MNSAPSPDMLCIGSVLWDLIGRVARDMPFGADRPGRITRQPGGVALNIALSLARRGLNVAVLGTVGGERAGADLVAEISAQGLDCAYLTRDPAYPTDYYMAVEDARGLVAAVADAHGLEAAGAQILAPLYDGRLGSAALPWRGMIALDGNLTADLLARFATDPALSAADLRLAPASPGKAERLASLISRPNSTIYVNLEEAGILAGQPFADAATAARALIARGAHSTLVTDGAALAAYATAADLVTATPPKVQIARVTGAGDCFMAAHIISQRQGLSPQSSLNAAVQAAARHVSGDTA